MENDKLPSQRHKDYKAFSMEVILMEIFKIHQTSSSLISWNKNVQFVLWNWKWIVFHNEEQQGLPSSDIFHENLYISLRESFPKKQSKAGKFKNEKSRNENFEDI